MKKFFAILLIFLGLETCCYAQVLKGGIEYTEEQIRETAFDGVKTKLSNKIVKKNQIDPFFDENQKLIEKKIFYTKTRRIHLFENGDYCVVYNNNKKQTFYYNSIGNLNNISIKTNPIIKFPYRRLLYDNNGNLIALVFVPSMQISYFFNPNGKLEKVYKH